MICKKLKKTMAILMASACLFGLAACGVKSSSDQTTLYGKVTAVSGTKVTLALGNLSQVAPQGGGQTVSGNQKAGTPPNGTASGSQGNPPGNSQGGGTGSQPQGNPPSGSKGQSGNTGNKPQGNPPSGGQGGGGPANITLTGKTKTITISDSNMISMNTMNAPNGEMGQASGTNSNSASNSASSSAKSSAKSSASLSDIKVGSILKVTYDKSGKLLSVTIMSSSDNGKPDSSTTSK